MFRAAATLPLAVLLAVSSLSAQELPPGFDEGVFLVQTARLSQQPLSVLTLVSPAGEVYLPLLQVLAYLGIPARATEEGLSMEWPPPAWSTQLHLPGGQVRRPERHFVLPPESLVLRGSEWHITLPALESLLEVRAALSWETLSIALSTAGDFPAERQRAVEARRRQVAGTEFDPELSEARFVPRSGGLGVDWALSGTASPRSHHLGASLTTGIALLGGSLEVGGAAALQDDELSRLGDPLVRFGRNFPGNPLVQQLELGHIRAEGPLPLQLFGFRLTNEPFVQPRHLGLVAVQPVLPAGWEYEVYEGSQLVGVGTSEPGGAVQTPVRYGTTPLTVRMIGPAGQERTEEMLLLMPVSRVPPGELRYFAGWGRCAAHSCETYGAGELRLGLTSRLTVGGGVDALTGSRSDGVRPHFALSASPFWSLNTEVQARPGFVNASLQHLGGQRQSYSARFLWAEESGPFGTSPGYRLDLTGQQALPSFLGGRWVSARLNLVADTARELTAMQGSLATPMRGGFVYVQHETGLQRDPITTLRLFRTVRLGGSGPTMGVSGSVGVERGDIGAFELGASLPLSQAMSGSAQMQWRPGDRVLLSLGYSARLGAALAQLRGSALRGTPTVFGSLRGGAGITPGVGLVGTPFAAVNRAGIAGRVFLDVDGSGSFTPGVDEPVEGVEVRAGGRRMRTDAAGRYRGWDLHPYTAVVVAVDTLQLPDLDFAPIVPFHILRPTPNLFNRLDIPLVRTREVTGRLVRGEGIASVAGVSVELVHQISGELTHVRTFSDGEFYVSRLAPGDYEVRVADASLRVLNAVSRPGALAVRVPVGEEEMEFALPPIRIERSDAADAGVPERIAVAPLEEAAPLPPPARDPPVIPAETPVERVPADPAPLPAPLGVPVEARPVEPLGVPAQARAAEPLGVPVTPLAPTRLRGTVRDTGTGSPVAARILAIPAHGGPGIEAVADPVGGGFLLDLPPGTTYGLQVTAPGYTPESVALDLTGVVGGGFLTANVGLARAPSPPPLAAGVVRLEGTIRDSETEGPLAARVVAVAAVGGRVVEATSEATNGRFTLDLPAGARYTLHVSAPGYAPEEASLNLTARLANDFIIVNAGLRRLP
jgi:hypothetical protein